MYPTIDEGLVRRLIETLFLAWSDLEVVQVVPGGLSLAKIHPPMKTTYFQQV